MSRSEIVKDNFLTNYNCSQSVLVSFKDMFDLPEKDLLKIACGFGAGMGRLQHSCGAVTGANMVIGLLFGRAEPDDSDALEKTYSLVQTFNDEFIKIHATTNCSELLGCDLQTEVGREQFKEDEMKTKICLPCVENAVKILEQII